MDRARRPTLLSLHLQGTATLGVYPVRADQTVLFGALDIDVRKSALTTDGASPSMTDQLREMVQADARRLARQFDQLHLPVYVEESGYKGVHLWIFFAEPVPAAEVKRFLEAVVGRVGPPSPEVGSLPQARSGRRLIHGIVGHCLDYSESITQQQIERTPPSPISCPKIRQRLPEVTSTVNCACVFDLPEGGYPSPLLHIDPAFTAGRSHNADRHGSLVDRYVNLRRDYQRVGRELAQLEDDLHYALNSVGQDELRAGGWILRRDKEGRLQVEVDLG